MSDSAIPEFPAAFAGPTEQFAPRLVAWQEVSGRHDLPWQNTTDPYRVWLSEIMLQQTQVSAVIPYYQRFLERFPTLEALAAAPVDDVMQSWSGLGYYSRARNLHACAQQVVERFGGQFPHDPVEINSLPGIGRSTAAAIASFCFGARAAILDGNVKRVLCRVFGIDGYPGERAVEQRLWSLAENLLPASGMETYTQGLMDLGATLCTPRRPRCGDCPVAQLCVARATHRQEELPRRKPARVVPQRELAMLVLHHGGEILLQKRPPVGIWGGLWSLPEFPVCDAAESTRVFAADRGEIDAVAKLQPFDHAFTHFRLHVDLVAIDLARLSASHAAEPGEVWMDLEEARGAALPTPIRKVVEGLWAASPRHGGGAQGRLL